MSFSESSLGDHDRENDRLHDQLSEREIQILRELTPANKNKVRSLHSRSLLKDRGAIVGVRTDDLFYFLESIGKGYIPVGPSPISI